LNLGRISDRLILLFSISIFWNRRKPRRFSWDYRSAAFTAFTRFDARSSTSCERRRRLENLMLKRRKRRAPLVAASPRW